MRRLVMRLGAAALLAAGCTREYSDFFAPEAGTIVVDGFLVVGRPFPEIVLTQTLAADAPFSLQRAALAGARVWVVGGGRLINYREVPGRAGIYAPDTAFFVDAESTYTLAVTASDGRRVSASTRTPKRFSVSDWFLLDDSGHTILHPISKFDAWGDSVYARPENQLVYSQGLLEGRYDAAEMIGLQVGLFSRTPNSPRVIDPDFVDEADLDSLPRVSNSPPLDPHSGTVRLPWFAIFFEGKYAFHIWSMDRNWFDLARTDPALRGGGFGFGGQAGDGFDRPIFHVEGGIGLFGSGSVDSVGVVIHPRP